ncbi:hypothetical protein BKA65DRAFT_87576 [Rhexocercosporidium sp. MPI-PUGE-AT-0058]|nr:hypothetical protein BKA65DRAFT_87576 [Rhexocercosporidium sp. MPI-PUGE-AT-0058]
MQIGKLAMNSSGFFDVLQDALSREAEATTNFGFLFPNASVTSLISNADFTASLHCSLETAESTIPKNISCIEACSNPALIFSNWSNFYTCSWYPTLSEALDAPDVSTSATDTFSSLGILPNQSILSHSISSDIATCLSDYCKSSDDCRKLDSKSQSCSLENLVVVNGSLVTLSRTNAITCLHDSVCSSTGAVNPDIGGLGVILSLLIQYTLSLLAIICHFLFYFRYQLYRKLWLRKIRGGKPDERLSLAKQTLTRHLEALTSALVEFQKAQCFFSATLQIAAIIVLPQYEIGENSKDQILLRLTSANAFAPIVLTLAHIDHLGGRNSKYLLNLSLITFCLGSSTYWLSFPIHGGGHNYFQYTPPAVPVMSCNNIAPFAPCYLRNQFFLFSLWTGDSGIFYAQPQRIGLAVWIVTLLILVYRIVSTFCTSGYVPRSNLQRVIDELAVFGRSVLRKLADLTYVQRLLVFSKALPSASTFREWHQKTTTFMGKRRTWVYIQIALGTMALIMQLVSVIQVLQFSSNIISTQMSFGQIVAVGIWVPVLLEYGYLEITGAAKGTEYRLKFPLVVTAKVPEATTIIPEMTSARGEGESIDNEKQPKKYNPT